jgi:hypothetical protein
MASHSAALFQANLRQGKVRGKEPLEKPIIVGL